MRKSYLILAVIALVALGFAVSAYAGTTGKIQGTVKDAQSGEPLPGANVVLEGTQRGATTDNNGFYIILLVEPRRYTMAASMVGYDTQTQTDVRVQSDFTTELNFMLRETSLELGEMVVVAERPPVEPDRTTTKYIMGAQDIENVPIVRSAEDFMELTAGVQPDQSGGDIRVRGGETKDVGYYVDGVRMTSTDHRGTRVYRDINRTAIQELTVITGGMDAEYGNAQGGVVSVVTRAGGQTYRGYGDYQYSPAGKKHWGANVYDAARHRGNAKWDDPDWVGETLTMADGTVYQAHRRLDYTGVSGHFLEGNVSGPVMKDMTFFVSSKWRQQASEFPGPNLTTPFNTNSTARLSYAVSPTMKLGFGGFYNKRDGLNGGPADGGRLNLDNSLKNLFLVTPNPSGENTVTDAMFYGTMTHSLSPQTFYEVRMSYATSRKDTLDVPLAAGVTNASEALSGNPVKDKAGYYTVYRQVVNWEQYNYKRLILKGDLSSQANRNHFLKTGFEMIRYDNWYQGYYSDGPSARQVRWFAKNFDSVDFFPGQGNEGLSPIQLGVYIQDKIEFEGMIVNAGLRADILFQRTYVTDVDGFNGAVSPMYFNMARDVYEPKIQGSSIKGLSPRVGVSHPITSKSLLRFFYGRFIQFPDFYTLFANDYSSQSTNDVDRNGNGSIDAGERWNDFQPRHTQHTSSLPPEETTSFEFGLDWNFVTEYVLGLTTYYKSAANQITTGSQLWRDPAAPAYVNQGGAWAPGVWRDIRGFELSVRKQFSQMFSFSLAYNMQWADQGRNTAHRRDTWPDSIFVANGHYWTTYTVDPTTGRQIPESLQARAIREGRDVDYYITLYGKNANNAIRSQQSSLDNRTQWSWIPWLSHYSAEGVQYRLVDAPDASKYDDGDRAFWERINSDPNYPGTGEGNLLVGHSQETGARAPLAQDRRAFGSMMFLFATPADFGPWGGKALGSLRSNLVYRVYTGTAFIYSSVISGLDLYKTGPMHTRTDLNVEKQFGSSSGMSLTLAGEVYNLFNQKDDRQVSPGGGRGIDIDMARWQKWGISGLDPTSGDYRTYGELNDINNYWDQPREMKFSARIKF